MKILLLTREYKHSSLSKCGGTGTFMANLAKNLVKLNHEVYVVGVNKSKMNFVDEGVKIHYFKSLFRRNFIVNFLRSFTKKISFLNNLHCKIHEYEKKNIAKIVSELIKKQTKPFDIIETHDFEGLYLFLDNSIPIVVRCHGSFSVLEKYFDYKDVELGKKHCEKEALKKAKNVVSISEFSEAVNSELFGITNFKRIYNGIATSIFKMDENAVIIPKSIFYFGNVAKEKGADVALEILIQLIKKHPEITFHFIGPENNQHKIEFLKTTETNQLKDKVYFYGFQKTDEIIKLLSKAEVVVFPSKGETFGLALCETMSLSKPVITSNIPSFKEIIINQENGFIANTIDDYCTFINQIFENKIMAKTIGNNARQTIINCFSQENMIEETIEYYIKVIENFKT